MRTTRIESEADDTKRGIPGWPNKKGHAVSRDEIRQRAEMATWWRRP